MGGKRRKSGGYKVYMLRASGCFLGSIAGAAVLFQLGVIDPQIFGLGRSDLAPLEALQNASEYRPVRIAGLRSSRVFDTEDDPETDAAVQRRRSPEAPPTGPKGFSSASPARGDHEPKARSEPAASPGLAGHAPASSPLARTTPGPQQGEQPANWQFCSKQFELCSCEGQIRWGIEGHFLYIQPALHGGGVMCTYELLGDPAPGENEKRCDCDVSGTAAAPAPSNLEWIFCSAQFMYCQCPGRIRWGAKHTWKVFKAKSEAVKCVTETLGDPLPGFGGKTCECEMDTTSDFYRQSISPAILTEAAAKNSEALLVASCEMFEAARDGDAWDVQQWKAAKGFCSDRAKPDVSSAGPRSLDIEMLPKMLKAWVNEGFIENYQNLYRGGWLEEAFVNFVAGAPTGGKWAKINEQLVRSVHVFSTRPVVIVHFGMSTPKEWDAKKYPRLVVMHAAPFPADSERRFDLNKFRSLLLSRVRTGIQLDSDQFVAPGVDALFQRVAEEITETYPMPILPVHFLLNEQLPMWPQKGQRGVTMSGGPSMVFDRFCKGKRCPGVTTRWGHAHPTWTYWALPFLSRWLRRHLRDEVLPPLAGDPLTALRVSDIDADEDLFNIGTWEEHGVKQWCKFDVADPVEFKRVLGDYNPKSHCNGYYRSAPPIQADPIFHPKGAANVFYTAHHAVNPEVSEEYISELLERYEKGSLPPPIYYMGCWYKDGKELKKAHPAIKCLI
ncbi:unnamed protein product [Polarella glacialis]|uniref:Uncharacterized protein n=1 Tax=Polarella glacialis TaxID=89957 RepID=A0A813GXT7_POLGL|nr:unnamed protein product [Polarella glacialis]